MLRPKSETPLPSRPRVSDSGFRDVQLFGNDVPVLCDDGRRQYFWAGAGIADRQPPRQCPHRIRGVQCRNHSANSQEDNEQDSRVCPPTETTNVVEPPKERARVRRPAKKSGGSSLEQLIALRDALRAAVNQANELIRVQKRHNRESRLVQSTLASLRQLQKEAC